MSANPEYGPSYTDPPIPISPMTAVKFRAIVPAMKNTRIGDQDKERRGEKLERQIRSKARENASSFGQSKRG